MAAFAALGGVPCEILYDRMKTAVIGENAEAHIVYNRALIDFASITGSSRRLVAPTAPRRRAKWSGLSATFARISSSPAPSAISTI